MPANVVWKSKEEHAQHEPGFSTCKASREAFDEWVIQAATKLDGMWDFQTSKQVGALAGLTPTSSQSGQSHRQRGIAKAGNRHSRAMAIEIAARKVEANLRAGRYNSLHSPG